MPAAYTRWYMYMTMIVCLADLCAFHNLPFMLQTKGQSSILVDYNCIPVVARGDGSHCCWRNRRKTIDQAHCEQPQVDVLSKPTTNNSDFKWVMSWNMQLQYGSRIWKATKRFLKSFSGEQLVMFFMNAVKVQAPTNMILRLIRGSLEPRRFKARVVMAYRIVHELTTACTPSISKADLIAFNKRTVRWRFRCTPHNKLHLGPFTHCTVHENPDTNEHIYHLCDSIRTLVTNNRLWYHNTTDDNIPTPKWF